MQQIWGRPHSATWTGITGFDVEATDGSIGTVDESSAAGGGAYIVVDTGHWIFGHKRLVPGGVIDRIDRQRETVFVRLTKEQVTNAPRLDVTNRELRGKDDDTYYENPVG